MQSFSVTTSVDKDTERKLRQALEQFPIAVQDAMVRKAIRKFLNAEMKQIRALNGSKLNPSHLKAKVKLFRSGVSWGATAYKMSRPNHAAKNGVGGRALRTVYDAGGVGWRSHFAELGTHTWSKALRTPPSARGLGWKRGLYHRGRGQYLRGTHASELVHRAMAPMFANMVATELRLLIEGKRQLLGNKTLRTVEEFS